MLLYSEGPSICALVCVTRIRDLSGRFTSTDKNLHINLTAAASFLYSKRCDCESLKETMCLLQDLVKLEQVGLDCAPVARLKYSIAIFGLTKTVFTV